MERYYPSDRAEKRQVLLGAVDRVRDIAVAHADECEALETLAPPVVEALAASRLWALKLPAELGGAEADPVTQIEVIEKMAHIDTSAGWALMIGATSIGWPGAYLPDAGVRRIFTDTEHLPKAAGIGGVMGTAIPVEGGYRVTGRFPFASGIRHAQWALAGAPVANGDDPPVESRMFIVPVEQSTVHLESWHVAGLKGTGSCDFSLEDVFVPAEMSWDRAIMANGHPERGGPIFRLGMPAYTGNEHVAFALGGTRRALEATGELAMKKRRGAGASAVAIADRQVFQAFYGEADQRLKAMRTYGMHLYENAWQAVCSGRLLEPIEQTELRAAGVMIIDACIDIVNQCFRFAGGSALQSTDIIQRCWRDVNASAQHGAVNNAGYEAYGQMLLGLGQPTLFDAGGNARA